MIRGIIFGVVTAIVGIFAGVSAFAVEIKNKPAEKPLEVIEGKSEIVVYQNGKARTLIVPPRMLESSRYFIKLADDDLNGSDLAVGQTTMDQRVQAQKLLFQANQEFIQGNVSRTWELVDKAKQLDPSHYRIKTMEGSLLYRMGSKDLAFKRWGESLQQNPDQPELLAIMKEANRKEAKR